VGTTVKKWRIDWYKVHTEIRKIILVFLLIKYVMQMQIHQFVIHAMMPFSTTPHAHNIHSLNSNPPIMTLSSIQSISNSRPLTLKQTSIIHSSTCNTTKNRYK
jgi:hypothetical protein